MSTLLKLKRESGSHKNIEHAKIFQILRVIISHPPYFIFLPNFWSPLFVPSSLYLLKLKGSPGTIPTKNKEHAKIFQILRVIISCQPYFMFPPIFGHYPSSSSFLSLFIHSFVIFFSRLKKNQSFN